MLSGRSAAISIAPQARSDLIHQLKHELWGHRQSRDILVNMPPPLRGCLSHVFVIPVETFLGHVNVRQADTTAGVRRGRQLCLAPQRVLALHRTSRLLCVEAAAAASAAGVTCVSSQSLPPPWPGHRCCRVLFASPCASGSGPHPRGRPCAGRAANGARDSVAAAAAWPEGPR
jgi:hypothetical protein